MSIKIKYQDQNLNKGTDKGRDMVQRSIDKFGMRDAVVIDKNGEIISGNHRKNAATKKGITKERIIEATSDEVIAIQYKDVDLSTPEGKELALALNQTAKFNINIDETLAIEELGEVVEEWGIEIPEEIPEASEDDFDTTPPENPITVLGDLYEIGEHRLLCGDSTDSDQVAKLMNGKKADMVFTDPPYGMNAVSKSGVLKDRYNVDIIGDSDTSTAKDSFNLIYSLFPDALHIWWGANYYSSCFPDSECWIVWDKNNGGSDQTDCELAWSNARSVVRQFTKASEKINMVHPNQKPIELFCWAIEKFCKNASFVLDLFLGSGSTMVASHQLKRKCYGMELDCKYVDVIVKRMMALDKNITVKRNGVDCKSEFIND